MIIQKSANEKIELNNTDNYGCTAFHHACENGHSKIAEMLIHNNKKSKLDLNAKTNYGSTAFHLACNGGSTEDWHRKETGNSI